MASFHLAGNFLRNSEAKSKIFKSYSKKKTDASKRRRLSVVSILYKIGRFWVGLSFLHSGNPRSGFCVTGLFRPRDAITRRIMAYKIHNLAMTSCSDEARILRGGIAGLHMLAFVKSKSQATRFVTTKIASHLSGPAEQDPLFSGSLSLGWRHATIISSLKAVTSAKERIFPAFACSLLHVKPW
jgi:hypothetical protein